MSKFRFSVFTATYNRGNLLPIVYESLVGQSFKDFEWIIIDDGSTDKTEKIVNGFIADNKLKSIKYVKKDNGGKHTAWRIATEMFEGEYIVSIDSDDFLSHNALNIFDSHWQELEESPDYESFWEVKARAVDETGNLVGIPLPSKIVDVHCNEFVFKNNFFFDLHGCRKNKVLREEAKVPDTFLFEQNCSNFKESIRWFRAGRKYKTRYVEEVTEFVTTSSPDRLSNANKGRSKKMDYNTLVGSLYTLSESRSDMLKWRKILYFKTLAIVLYYGIVLRINVCNLKEPKIEGMDKFLMFLGFIPIYSLYIIRKTKLK